MKTLIVTTPQLTEILANIEIIKGMANFTQVTQFTTPKITKKDRDTKEINTFASLKKLSNINILLNTEYVAGVTNQLIKENKEETEYKKGRNTMPLVKGTKNNFFGMFNGNAVIEYRPFDKSYPQTKYVVDGKIVDKENLPNVLPQRNKASNQGTDKEIHWRKLYVSNIRRITINGQKYKVVNK